MTNTATITKAEVLNAKTDLELAYNGYCAAVGADEKSRALTFLDNAFLSAAVIENKKCRSLKAIASLKTALGKADILLCKIFDNEIM